MTHEQEKQKQGIRINYKITQMLELADKDFKRGLINMFRDLKKM
jgi:hypothetical protein